MSRSLTLLRKLLVEVAADSGEVTRRQLQQLLNDRQFSTGLFALFAPLDCSLLPQDDWWEKMRSAPMEAWLGQADYREELVDLLEAVAFQVRGSEYCGSSQCLFCLKFWQFPT